MKGFIEIFGTSGDATLVNIHDISNVFKDRDGVTTLTFVGDNGYLLTSETYEEIKANIKEASE